MPPATVAGYYWSRLPALAPAAPARTWPPLGHPILGDELYVASPAAAHCACCCTPAAWSFPAPLTGHHASTAVLRHSDPMPDIAPAMPLLVIFTGIAGLPESIGDALLTGSNGNAWPGCTIRSAAGNSSLALAATPVATTCRRRAGAADTGWRRQAIFAASDGWHCNLAHSEELVACVLSRAPCGIDVEAIRPLAEMAGCWRTNSPANGTTGASARRAAAAGDGVYRWWTLRKPGSRPLAAISPAWRKSAWPGSITARQHCAGPLARGPQQLLELELRPGYRTAACLLSDTVATVHCVESPSKQAPDNTRQFPHYFIC